MTERPPVRVTARVLTVGTALAAGLLTLSFVLSLARLADAAGLASTVGILVLLATPAAGLVATFVELRPFQPRAALLAIGVLAILAVAAGVALVSR